MNWFRTYNEIIDDPKILRLSYEFRWFFVGILAISSRQFVRGSLPDLKEISISLRITKGKAARVIQRFIDEGFIDVSREDGTLSVHGWNKRQFNSDDITARTAASKKRSRERSQRADPEHVGNVPYAGARSETETEIKDHTSVKEPCPDRSPPPRTHEHAPARRPAAEAQAILEAKRAAERNGRPPPAG